MDEIDRQIAEFQRNPLKGSTNNIIDWEPQPFTVDELNVMPSMTENEERQEQRIFLTHLTGFFFLVIGLAVTITAGVALFAY